MSWAMDDDYDEFKRAAHRSDALIAPPSWLLQVWDVTDENPEGAWHEESSPHRLGSKARLRIVFAPIHAPEPLSLPGVVELFRLLHIPSDFTTSVLQSACHSFGRRTDDHGYCSWFHFLFKNISLKYQHGKLPEVDNRVASHRYGSSTLPQADYSWLMSGYFLRQHEDGSTVLVCFGAQPRVQQRIKLFIDGGRWDDANINPYIFFDLVLDGLYFEVDERVWNMNIVLGPLEHSILELAHTREYAHLGSKISFAALHNCAKHIIFLAEGLEACVMAVDAVSIHGEDASQRPCDAGARVRQQLRDRMRYRRSLFRSTQLRLSSLQKRIDNLLTLAFHVVTQKDSMVVTRDSSVMKMIAAITMIFLPTTGVAAVAGSQLLTTSWNNDSKSWSIMVTPLFWLTWWISIPLTVCVLAMALFWQWWAHAERSQSGALQLLRNQCGLTRSLFGE